MPLCMNIGKENVIKMLKRIRKNTIDMILDIILFIFSLFYVLTVVLCIWRAKRHYSYLKSMLELLQIDIGKYPHV